jgi:hypothetical protein
MTLKPRHVAPGLNLHAAVFGSHTTPKSQTKSFGVEDFYSREVR